MYADKAQNQSSVTVGLGVGRMADRLEGSNAAALAARTDKRVNDFMKSMANECVKRVDSNTKTLWQTADT